MGVPNLINLKEVQDESDKKTKRISLVEGNLEKIKTTKILKKELIKLSKNNPTLVKAYLGFSLVLTKNKKDKLFTAKMGGVTSYFYQYFMTHKDESEDKIINNIIKMYPKDIQGNPLRFIGEVSLEQPNEVISQYELESTPVNSLEKKHKLRLGAVFLPDYQNNDSLPYDGIYKAIYQPSLRDPELEKRYVKIMNKIQSQLYSQESETYKNYGISIISKLSPSVSKEQQTDNGELYVFGKNSMSDVKYYCQNGALGPREMIPLISMTNDEKHTSVQVYGDLINYITNNDINMYLKIKIKNE